jgi:putative pyruvate formate lyase activating enzyme
MPISQTHKLQLQNEVTHERLAEMMMELQERGCHNINFVSPTHFAPQMARSILLAAQSGLRLPIVYNTNAYDAAACEFEYFAFAQLYVLPAKESKRY